MRTNRKITPRQLEELQKRYSELGSAGKGGRGHGGPGGPGMGRPGGGPRGMSVRAKGKPKNSKVTIKRLLSYMAAYKGRLVIVILFMLINSLTSVVGGYMLREVINMVNLEHPVEDSLWLTPLYQAATEADVNVRLMGLGMILVLMAAIYGIGIATAYIQARLMLHISQNAVEKIRNDMFRKMQSLPVRYFDTHATGELMSRYTNDVDNIDMMINHTATSLLSGVVTLVATFSMMIYLNPWLTLITVVFIPIFMYGGAFIAKKSSKYYGGQQRALGAVNGYIEETVTGAKVVKAFNHEATCEAEFELLNDDMRKKQFKAQFYGGIMGPIMGNTSQISFAVTAGIGGLLCLYGAFDVGGLAVFCNYSRQFSMPINMISQQTSTIFSALAGAERVFAMMDEAPEGADRPDAIGTRSLRGEVVLENVTFGYKPEHMVLKNLSLYAHAGQKIAFVGSTGAGKTTITNLLNRFYDVGEGTITIDGVDIKAYRRDELRESVAMVLQDTHLFSDTIMENIRYGRLDATDEEVISAAKTASAHSFIMRLENGYQTRLDGDGANLSQGQRQLLNIARAALSKAPILVLDEATSSVDTRTERHIEHGMDRLMNNRTTFVIAHRLSTVRNADAIMVLEKGEIIERGNHEQLLALKGRYYELYTGLKELD